MNTFLKKLRNRKTDTASFRMSAQKLCHRLMLELSLLFKKKHVASKNIVFVVILRSAVVFLESVNYVFPKAPVGVLGIKRDEETANPRLYYENLPPIHKGSVVVILDPMLATGGSAEAALLRLLERGARLENIYFLGVVGAPQGYSRLSHFIPKENIILAEIDKGLDKKNYIVPGLGDFGDRYFGHSGKASFH